MTAPAAIDPAPTSRWTLTRWRGLCLGVAMAIADTAMLGPLGIDATLGGRDASLVVGLWFGASFASLGFLAGWLAEMRRRQRAFDAALVAAQRRLAQAEKLAALGQLATQVAHEVRNPLAVIRSAAQDLRDTPAEPGDGARAAGFIVDEVDRLSNVVSALLAFARPLAVKPRGIPVGALFDRALALAGSALAAQAVRVVRSEAPELPPLHADADLLCQALIDLLANAAEAAGPGGEVGLEARVDGARLELAVTDSGPGVAVSLRERIFEPFFTTRPHGTGLGLAVARQIVEAHGGTLVVGDRTGGGARFSLWVPA